MHVRSKKEQDAYAHDLLIRSISEGEHEYDVTLGSGRVYRLARDAAKARLVGCRPGSDPYELRLERKYLGGKGLVVDATHHLLADVLLEHLLAVCEDPRETAESADASARLQRLLEYLGQVNCNGLEGVLYESRPEAFDALMKDLQLIGCDRERVVLEHGRETLARHQQHIGVFDPETSTAIRDEISEISAEAEQGVQGVCAHIALTFSPLLPLEGDAAALSETR